MIDPVPAGRAEVAKRRTSQLRGSLEYGELAADNIERVRRNYHRDTERTRRKFLTILTMTCNCYQRFLVDLVAHVSALAGPRKRNVHFHPLQNDKCRFDQCNTAPINTSGLAATLHLVMNFQHEHKCSIHLVVGGRGRRRDRRGWRDIAFDTDNAVPVGRRFCVRSVLRADERLVAGSPGIRAIDQQLAPRRQH